jgi:hypothetical protein
MKQFDGVSSGAYLKDINGLKPAQARQPLTSHVNFKVKHLSLTFTSILLHELPNLKNYQTEWSLHTL